MRRYQIIYEILQKIKNKVDPRLVDTLMSKIRVSWEKDFSAIKSDMINDFEHIKISLVEMPEEYLEQIEKIFNKAFQRYIEQLDASDLAARLIVNFILETITFNGIKISQDNIKQIREKFTGRDIPQEKIIYEQIKLNQNKEYRIVKGNEYLSRGEIGKAYSLLSVSGLDRKQREAIIDKIKEQYMQNKDTKTFSRLLEVLYIEGFYQDDVKFIKDNKAHGMYPLHNLIFKYITNDLNNLNDTVKEVITKLR